MGTKRVKVLRTIADPFVVALPTGTSTLTRLHPTPAEESVLREVGTFLGAQYRKDLVARTRIGVVPAALNQRTERKRALTGSTSSRWAGAITRSADDQYRLAMRALEADRLSLTTAIKTLQGRLAAPVGGQSDTGVAGYRSRQERLAKQDRLSILQTRLAAAEAKQAQGTPTIVVGGGRLWKNRQNLAAAKLTEPQWRAQWDAARLFLTADGEAGQIGGNQTIRVDDTGMLRMKTPAALTAKLGPYLTMTAPVAFALRGEEWRDRVQRRQSIRYDITYNAESRRWYLRASWSYKDLPPVPPVATLQTGTVIGVDLNADHLTAGTIDTHGNPVGVPKIISLLVAGLPASTRDGHLRQAITTLLDAAENAGAGAIAIENLNFIDARHSGRETMGRGRSGKRFRRTVSGIPTGKFRERLTAMAANRGIHIIAVDPAYTSRWGAQHWAKPLQRQHRISAPAVTAHQAAAVAIGRRALGHSITRRKDGRRPQPRMRSTQPLPGVMMKPQSTPTASTGRPRQQPPRLTG